MKEIIAKVKENIDNEIIHPCAREKEDIDWFDGCDCCGWSPINGDKNYRNGLLNRVSIYLAGSGYRICEYCLTIYIREVKNNDIYNRMHSKYEKEGIEDMITRCVRWYIWEESGGRLEQALRFVNGEGKKLNISLSGEEYQENQKWFVDIFWNGKVIKKQGGTKKLKDARHEALKLHYNKALEQGYYPVEWVDDASVVLVVEGRRK